jgi:hypothetical protein
MKVIQLKNREGKLVYVNPRRIIAVWDITGKYHNKNFCTVLLNEGTEIDVEDSAVNIAKLMAKEK